MDQTTEEVSSGKKVQAPSDNPANYAQNLEVLAQQSQNSQYKSNLNSLQTAASYYQTSVNSLSNVLTTIQQLAVQQASSTADSNSRSSAGTEVNDLIQQLAAVGNTKVGDTYIFGGTESNNPAYTVDTSSGTPVVTFQGSADVGQVAVNNSTTVAAGFSGQSIFTGTVNGQSVDIFQTLETFSERPAEHEQSELRPAARGPPDRPRQHQQLRGPHRKQPCLCGRLRAEHKQPAHHKREHGHDPLRDLVQPRQRRYGAGYFRLQHPFDRLPGGALRHVKGREHEHTQLLAHMMQQEDECWFCREKKTRAY